jgi:DNA-binding response OmpR family regulator
MRVLVAEDDATTQRLLQALLKQWGYQVVTCANGDAAWAELSNPGGPSLGIVDWLMPGIDGPEVIRRARGITDRPVYLIVLTSKSSTEDIVAAFGAGADDYLVKPFQPAELRVRVRAGHRVLELEANLRSRVKELEEALTKVKKLQGLLPICSYCKKVRDDRDYWQQVETYVESRTDAQFSHGICPDCYTKHVQPQLDALDKRDIKR